MSDNLPVSTQCIRALQDKQYDKRKWAAGEIEKTIRKAKASSRGHEDIGKVLDYLSELAYSTNPSSRKGGVIGLAAIAIGLGNDFKDNYIEPVTRPMFSSLDDQDSQVRYFTCEALFNVMKTANINALRLFEDIFDKLAKLSADSDSSVRNAADSLDKLLKNIIEQTDKSFDITIVIRLLHDRALVKNLSTKQFIVSWIYFLKNKMLNVDMIDYLSDLLDGLFNILADSNEEIRKQCEEVLNYYLKKIRQNQTRIDCSKMINPLLMYTDPKFDEIVRFIALSYIYEFLSISPLSFLPYLSGTLAAVLPCLSPAISKSYAQDEDAVMIDFSSTNKRYACMTANYDLQGIASSINDDLMLLVCKEQEKFFDSSEQEQKKLQETDEREQMQAEIKAEIDNNLTSQVRLIEYNSHFSNIIKVLKVGLKQERCPQTKVAILKWILHLHTEIPDKTSKHLEFDLFELLVDTIKDQSKEVTCLNLELLCKIFTSAPITLLDKANEYKLEISLRTITNVSFFARFMNKFMQFLYDDTLSLDKKGSSIIRQLCNLLCAKDVYCSFAHLLLSHEDLDFVDTMVQILNKILLSCSELYTLRNELKQLSTREDFDLFCSLYRTWCYSPIACLSLCFLSRNYVLAYRILLNFGVNEDITSNFLQEIDKLVQLIESPIFAYLRLDLLECERNHNLVKSLYGLLMVLPQSKGFHLLRKRLQCVPNFKIKSNDETSSEENRDPNVKYDKGITQILVNTFSDVREKHRQFKHSQATKVLHFSEPS